MNAHTKVDTNAVEQVRDIVRGTAAAGAIAAGWGDEQALLISRKAEEATVSRIVAGVAPETALAGSIVEADLIVTLDTFERALQKSGDPMSAFRAVAKIKEQATKDLPEGKKISLAAEREFSRSIAQGLSPAAALASAFATAGAVSRLIEAASKD